MNKIGYPLSLCEGLFLAGILISISAPFFYWSYAIGPGLTKLPFLIISGVTLFGLLLVGVAVILAIIEENRGW